MRSHIVGLIVATMGLFALPAWGIGTLVGPDGSTISLTASRTLLVRTGVRVRLITQIKYEGDHPQMIWLVPIPNFNNAPDDGVRIAQDTGAALTAFAATTQPSLTGECDGMASGQQTQIEFSGGPFSAQEMVLPHRFFSIPMILNGDLNTYLGSVNAMVDEPLQTAIDEVVDQNLMLVAFRIDTATHIDPIVSIDYPLDGADPWRLSLRPTATATKNGPADLLFMVLGDGRAKFNLTTDELDLSTVSFTSPTETDYLDQIDATVGPRQTRMFITEFAGPVAEGAFASVDADTIIRETGVSFLTRLHARFSEPALRAGSGIVQLQLSGTAAYGNEHTVGGFMCAGEDPDMGAMDMGTMDPDPDQGVDPTPDMTMPQTDTGSGGDGDDDDGGCAISSGRTTLPLFLLLFILGLSRPLRRRSR